MTSKGSLAQSVKRLLVSIIQAFLRGDPGSNPGGATHSLFASLHARRRVRKMVDAEARTLKTKFNVRVILCDECWKNPSRYLVLCAFSLL